MHRFQHHGHQPHGRQNAARLVSRGQITAAVAVVAVAAVAAVVFGPLALLKTAVAAAIAFYVVFVGFKFVLWWAAARSRLPGSTRFRTRTTPTCRGTRSWCRCAGRPT